MGTKLESLVKILGDSVEQEILDKLILDYYIDQNVTDFITDEGEYQVLTQGEQDELLYDAAEGLYADYESKLLELIERMYSQDREKLAILARSIDEEKAIQSIANELDYEEEYGKTMIGSDRIYAVFTNEHI